MTSIRYAIRSETPEHEWVKDKYNYVTNRYFYSPAPQAIAEGDLERGVSAVFTTTGEQASPWIKIYDPKIEEEMDKLKPFPSLTDMFNTPLNIGDYALSAFDERSNYVSLCRVVGFTSIKVKVRHLGWNMILSRNPAMLVRVHDSIIIPEPN